MWKLSHSKIIFCFYQVAGMICPSFFHFMSNSEILVINENPFKLPFKFFYFYFFLVFWPHLLASGVSVLSPVFKPISPNTGSTGVLTIGGQGSPFIFSFKKKIPSHLEEFHLCIFWSLSHFFSYTLGICSTVIYITSAILLRLDIPNHMSVIVPVTSEF